MVTTKKLIEKRVAYLACSLCLHPDHSFIMLLINALQLDLKSENYLEASGAFACLAVAHHLSAFSLFHWPNAHAESAQIATCRDRSKSRDRNRAVVLTNKQASMALVVVCKLVNAETIPALLPLIVTQLEHKYAARCATRMFRNAGFYS